MVEGSTSYRLEARAFLVYFALLFYEIVVNSALKDVR